MKLTKWFPGDIKPVRRGVYERSIPKGHVRPTVFAYWNGQRWSAFAPTPEWAADPNCSRYCSQYQLLAECEWRGLAVNPNRRKAKQAP